MNKKKKQTRAKKQQKKLSVWEHAKEWSNFIFSLIAAITAIGSLWLTHSTLTEMQVERQNAYRPSIQFSSAVYAIQTGDNIDKEYLDSITEGKEIPIFSHKNTDGGYSATAPELILDVYNIGVGTAKDIKISISSEASHNAIDVFNEKTKYCNAGYGEGVHGDILFYYEEGNMEEPFEYFLPSFLFAETIEMPYLLPNAGDTSQYPLPPVYSGLINALIIDLINAEYNPFGEGLPSIPDIEIQITYSDVQGIVYQENAYIKTHVFRGLMGGQLIKVSIVPQGTQVQ